MKKKGTIGIEVKWPENECDDQYCPFHGNLKLRGLKLNGVVVSTKMQKSAVVQMKFTQYLPKYERYIKKRSKITVHNPPCIGAKEGDEVMISECRPLSKTKNFVILSVHGKSKTYVSKDQLYEVEEKKMRKSDESSDNKIKKSKKQNSEGAEEQ